MSGEAAEHSHQKPECAMDKNHQQKRRKELSERDTVDEQKRWENS